MRIKNLAILIPLLVRNAITAFLVVFASLASAQTLYSVTNSDDQLRVIDISDASTISSVTMTLPGETISGATGAATHPATGEFWVLLKATGGSGRLLATVDLVTGVVTPVGYTGESFAAITFDASGATLYGVTGDGSSTPESLFTLDQVTATPTLLTALGNGTDGETIAFHPTTGLLYHGSGHTGSDVIFESIDPVTLVITDIPLAGNALEDEEVQALLPIVGGFLWKQDHGTGPLFSVDFAGVPTLIGGMDHQAKGLAFGTPPFPAVAAAPPAPPEPVPTLGNWALLLLALFLVVAVARVNYRKGHLSGA